MSKNLITLAAFILLLSGCVTTQEIKEAQIQQLQERVSCLESQLKQKEEEGLILKKELAKLQKRESQETVILQMPNARQIQTALKNAGFYKDEIDGQIGTKTKEAIKKFQEANGLNPDGVVGSRTWERLKEYLKE